MTGVTAPKLLDGRLKLRHLLLVDALTEFGSTLRAAEHLHVTQPAASRGLQELEDILGVELYLRTPRGVTPTIFGTAFTAHARDVIAQLHRAGRHVEELAAGGGGTVTVGTHLFGSNVLLPRAVAEFKRAHPDSTVVVVAGTPDELHSELLAGRVELVVGRLYPLPGTDRLAHWPLYEEQVCVAARRDHPLRGGPGPDLATLARLPWVLPGAGTSLRQEFENLLLRAGVPLPDDRVECTSFLTVRGLLLASDAVGLMSELIVEGDADLEPLAPSLPELRSTVGVTTAVGRGPSPSAEALLAQLYRAAEGM